MLKRLFIFFAIIGLCCTTALAGEQKGPALADWLKVVQKKIETIMPRKILPPRTGVARERGAKADPFVKLYWKGKTGEELVTEEELTEFKAAFERAVRGEREAAITGLEKFLEQYPDSALVPDAKKTLDLVKAEATEAKKAVVKKEKKE
jgi:TolA-binding protein